MKRYPTFANKCLAYNMSLAPFAVLVWVIFDSKISTWFLPAATKLWPRCCFYRCLSFILFTGGVSGEPPLDHWEPPWTIENPPGRENPPEPRENPPTGRTPPWPGRPPRTRENPPSRENPPGPRWPLPRKNTAAYGEWAAGTHPTRMHSCFTFTFTLSESENFPWPLPLLNVNSKLDFLRIPLKWCRFCFHFQAVQMDLKFYNFCSGRFLRTSWNYEKNVSSNWWRILFSAGKFGLHYAFITS